jgi:hypothetical protein
LLEGCVGEVGQCWVPFFHLLSRRNALRGPPLDPKVLAECPAQTRSGDRPATRPGDEDSAVELAQVGRVTLGSLDHGDDPGRTLSVVGDLVASTAAMPTTQNDEHPTISKLAHYARRGSDVEAPPYFVTQVLVDVGRCGHAAMLTKTFA